jgi:predicted phage terminase large subunit-like protein
LPSWGDETAHHLCAAEIAQITLCLGGISCLAPRTQAQCADHLRLVRAGEALHAEREPLQSLEDIRRILGEYNFSGQYQQEPAPFGGGMVKAEWFKTYKVGDAPAKFDLIFQSWDTAVKATELNDNSVCTTWGMKEKNLYLLHVLRRRMEYPDLKRAVLDQARRFNPATILIEDKSSGAQLIQDLRRDGLHAVTPYEPKMDKIMRLHSVTNTVEQGFVYLPDKAEWVAEYLHELTTFPKGKFDDQCDSTSQALDWIKTGYKYEHVLQILKHLAQHANSPISHEEVGPCPNCRSKSTFADGGEACCHDCGKRWDRPIPPIRVTRADMLNGRWGFKSGPANRASNLEFRA